MTDYVAEVSVLAKAVPATSDAKGGGRSVGIAMLGATGTVALVASFSDHQGFRVTFWLVFCACLVLGGSERFLLNPYYMFSLTPLSIAVYDASFAPAYLSPLSTYTYALVLYNVLLFVAGLSAWRFRPESTVAEVTDKGSLRWRVVLLFAVGLLPSAYRVATAPGLARAGNFVELAKTPNLPYGWLLGLFMYPALTLALKSRRKGTILLALLIFAANLTLFFNKTQLVFFLMTLAVALHRYRPNGGRGVLTRRLVTFGSALMLVGSVVWYDKVRSDFDTTDHLILTGANQSVPEFLILPYMYFVSAWNNLRFVIETQPQRTYGEWFARPVTAFWDPTPPQLTAANNFNTFSFVAVQWKDFGFVGSGLVALLLGLYIGWLFDAFKRSDSAVLASVYALNTVAVAEMFFSNHFFGVLYPFAILFIGVVLRSFIPGFRTRRT